VSALGCGIASMLEYERDGNAIYARSFAIIRAEADLGRFAADEAEVAVRMIHACGMVEAAAAFTFAPGFVAAGRQALRVGRAGHGGGHDGDRARRRGGAVHGRSLAQHRAHLQRHR